MLLRYGLKPSGRRETITEDNGRVTNYIYDDLYRLKTETITDPVNGDYSADYSYDYVGKGGDLELSINTLLMKINDFTTIFSLQSDLTRSQNLMHTRLRCGTKFVERINHINAEQRVRFFTKIFEKGGGVWNASQHHDSESYYEYSGECVTDTSIAEIAERSLSSEYTGVLISFEPSSFDGVEWFWVKKEGERDLTARNFVSRELLVRWLEKNRKWKNPEYLVSDTDPPNDFQTCLIDELKYVKTSLLNKGRIVYQEKTTKRYFCVDLLHHGRSAHLEVWDKRKRHIGEASLDGIIDFGRADSGKNNRF